MLDKVTRFATDRLDDLKDIGGAISNEVKYSAGQLRDKAVVPAIDNAMEAGLLRSDAGMFGRYLSGTSVPLTKMPLDIKRDEEKMANMLSGIENNNERKQKHTSLRNNIAKSDDMSASFNTVKQLFKEQQESGVDIKAYNMGLEDYDSNKVSLYNNNENQIQDLIQKHGKKIRPFNESNPAPYFSDNDRAYAASEFKPFDKNNYTDARGGMRESNVESATKNTLGRYSVKNGIINDQYDFNSFQKPGDTFQSGGALTDIAGRVSHQLGLIKPGSGYEVRLDTGRR